MYTNAEAGNDHCFRSTMGVEATYRGKPAIALIHAYYRGLNAVHEPSTREDALKLVIANLTPKPCDNAVKFGAFMRSGGHRVTSARPTPDDKLLFHDTIPRANAEIRWWASHCFSRKSSSGVGSILRACLDSLRYAYLLLKHGGWLGDGPRSIHSKVSRIRLGRDA